MPTTERKERQPLPPRLSNNARLEALFGEVDYLNREYTIAIPTTPLYIEPDLPSEVQGEIDRNLRVVLTPGQFRRLDRQVRKQIEVRASVGENGRVLEADEPILIDGKKYILISKGGGATAVVRSGKIDFQQKVKGVFGKDATFEPIPDLSSISFSPKYGWLDYKEAHEELVLSQKLKAMKVDSEKVVAIYRIDALPDSQGMLQPIEYFKATGVLPESADPVLLFRALQENIRLQDIARLEDLGHAETAGKLVRYGAKTFATVHGISGHFTEEDYFVALSQNVINDLFPLFLRGCWFDAYSWHDQARNISLVGEQIDVGRFRALRGRFRDVADFLYSQGDTGNTMYPIATVLLRFAEQIRRHTQYNLKNAPDVIKEAVSHVIQATDFNEILEIIEDTEIEKRGYYRGRVGTRELQWMIERHMDNFLEKFRRGYESDTISKWSFQVSIS